MWEAYAPLLSRLAISFLILLGLSALAVIFAVFLSRRITRPIIQLRDATRQIGAGDLNARIEVEANNEIGELANSFNQMVTDLNSTTVSRDALSEEVAIRKETEKQLKNATIQAEMASKAKSDFLANMSHEIRTPMNGVIGMTEILLETTLSDEQRDFAETIRVSADSLLSVINDILDFSKVEAGKLDLENIDFDLRTNLEDVAEVLALSAARKGLEFACLFNRDVSSSVRGDPGRLRQILVNLCNNAIKFTESGEVSIVASLDSAANARYTIRFEVKDTGIGIPEDRLHRLFRSFSQVDSSTTRQFGGTGLGLAISKQLAELMGGQVGVESQAGVGSTFWFTVVLDPAQKNVSKLPSTKDVLGDKRILVVDDIPTNRRVVVEQLEPLGCRLSEAESGTEALGMLEDAAQRDEPFDLALLDMQMPGMDGLEVGRKIREQAHGSRLPLVMLTSMGHQNGSAEFLDVGFAAHLVKPVKQARLIRELSAILAPTVDSGDDSEDNRIQEKSDSATKPLNILLAEDNATNQLVATHILQRLGHEVTVVGNGRLALEAVQDGSFDLVLMDVQMPEMDGIEATGLIRALKDERLERLPIIAMTAHAMKGDRERFLQAGMNDYTPKPVKSEDLQKTIERWASSGSARIDEKQTSST